MVIEIGSGVTWEGMRLLPGGMETVPLWIWRTEMERHTKQTLQVRALHAPHSMHCSSIKIMEKKQ